LTPGLSELTAESVLQRLAPAIVTFPLVLAMSALQRTDGPQASRPKSSRVLVVAHRGGAGIAAENTLSAFRKAVRVGADYVEVDVRCTADGRLIVMHDGTVDRTTNGSGEVARMTWADIAALRIRTATGSPSLTVPTFDDVVGLWRNRTGLYIDHKDAPVEKVVETLKRHRFGRKVVVYGSPDRLREYRKFRPDMPIMPGHPGEPGLMASLVALLHPETMDGHAIEWTREQVRAAHGHGAEVWMDVMGPTDSESGWRDALEKGADALQTDYPDRLIRYLKQRRLR